VPKLSAVAPASKGPIPQPVSMSAASLWGRLYKRQALSRPGGDPHHDVSVSASRNVPHGPPRESLLSTHSVKTCHLRLLRSASMLISECNQ